MADITMCSGKLGKKVCKLRKNCVRFISKPNPKWQSWYAITPFKSSTKCEEYWEDKKLN